MPTDDVKRAFRDTKLEWRDEDGDYGSLEIPPAGVQPEAVAAICLNGREEVYISEEVAMQIVAWFTSMAKEATEDGD